MQNLNNNKTTEFQLGVLHLTKNVSELKNSQQTGIYYSTPAAQKNRVTPHNCHRMSSTSHWYAGKRTAVA
jgi:hypothetical protein